MAICFCENGLRGRRGAFSPNDKPTRGGLEGDDAGVERFRGDGRAAALRAGHAGCSRRTARARWVMQLYRGLERAAARFAVAIVGGETSGTRGTGGHFRRCRRFGGKRSLRFPAWRQGRRRPLCHRRTGWYREKADTSNFVPRIEEARWLTKHFRVHAMMDLSDGIGDGSSPSSEGERRRFSARFRDAAARPGLFNRSSDQRRRRLRTTVRGRTGRRFRIGNEMATEISSAALDQNWRFRTQKQNQEPTIAPWLRSFPIASRKRSLSRGLVADPSP